MANAKKLTRTQITALQWLARGDDPFRRYGRYIPNCGSISTLRALFHRGLIVGTVIGGTTITSAGRQALFEATGENTLRRLRFERAQAKLDVYTTRPKLKEKL